MLVSNHINTIRNCMESIKPLLDAIPSELVVLDTKGEETDGSIDIVREYTDKIYRLNGVMISRRQEMLCWTMREASGFCIWMMMNGLMMCRNSLISSKPVTVKSILPAFIIPEITPQTAVILWELQVV